MSNDVNIAKQHIDNRSVLEVRGRQFGLQNVLADLEILICSHSTIEEVRFICGRSFEIDADLKNEVWHGKNVVVNAREIHVTQPVCWDVSGKSSTHEYKQNAGTGEDGKGLNGKDGYPGESGGNVLIVAQKRITNLERMMIISNGGAGSNGQDGGNGVAGKDGTGIKWSDFANQFPPAASVNVVRSMNVEKIIANITKLGTTKFVHHVKNRHPLKLVKNGLGLATYLVSLGNIGSNTAFTDSCFLNYKTDEGHTITFSFQDGDIVQNCQAFLVYEGSTGTPGKSGGEYGSGGQGGRAGDISVICLEDNQNLNVNSCNKIGSDGKNGRGGVNGRHGKKGWDVGYVDHTIGRVFNSWPLYYGADENSTLTLSYYKDKGDERVYCPYYSEYAEIKSSRIKYSDQKTLEERNNSKSNSERQHHARAVGKKTISKQCVINAYSEFMDNIAKEIQAEEAKRLHEEESTRQAVEKKKQEEMQRAREEAERKIEEEKQHLAAEKKKQEEMQREREAELATRQAAESDRLAAEEEMQLSHSMNRSVSFDLDSIRHHCKVTVNVSRPSRNNGSDSKTIQSDFLSFDEWLSYSTQTVNGTHLVELIKTYTAFRKSRYDSSGGQKLLGAVKNILSFQTSTHDDDNNKDLVDKTDEMFINKYKFYAWQELALPMPPYFQCEIQTNYTAETISKFLEETPEKNSKIHQAELGTMKQYIFENTAEIRNKIVTFINEIMEVDNTVLLHAIKSFVLETEFSENIDECAERFRRELLQSQYKHVVPFWDACNEEKTEEELRKIFENDEILINLLDNLNQAKLNKTQYESNEAMVDEDDKKNFVQSIKINGIKSKSCRELLAYVFDVNLRVYACDENFEYVLCEDHNPSSTIKNHILFRDDDFIQLEIDTKYIMLIEDRLYKDNNYGKQIMDIDNLTSIENIEKYLKKPTTTTKNVENILFDEKAAVETVASYFNDEERIQMKHMLGKVTYEYTKQKGVLQHILQRFACEGRHISFEEMGFFINSILNNFANGGQEVHTFAWIVAAYTQQNWVDEALLLHLETYFKKQLTNKLLWREYMGKVRNKDVLLVLYYEIQINTCSEEYIQEILYLLSSIPIESISFEGVQLSEWCYFLKEHYWAHKLQAILEWNKDDGLNDASYYMSCIENTVGFNNTTKLVDELEVKKLDLTNDILIKILSNLQKQKWNITDVDIESISGSTLRHWIDSMERKYKPQLEDFDIKQLTEIVGNDKKTSKNIINNLPKIHAYIQNMNDRKSSELQMLRYPLSEGISPTYEELLAVIDQAILLRRGFRLRDTQRLTILALLTNKRSTLAQVSTGEGKSLIVVATTIVKVLLHENVDIVTSSPVLAKRDAEVNKDIYDLFNIGVSHNCSLDMETRKETYSNYQVVYGDLASFQRDYLLDRFYGKNVLGDRNFSCVIVDEVDSMLLDKGNNMLYLSHDIPGMDKLEAVYVFIWQAVNSSMEEPEDIDTDEIRDEILSNLHDKLDQKELAKLDPNLSERKIKLLWECLVKGGTIDFKGNVMVGAINSTKLQEILTPEFVQYKHRLSYLLTKYVNREKYIIVPNFLKKFVETHLESWINSAINALLMVPDDSYVVSYIKSGAKADRTANIVILDKDTGTDQGSSQWDEALHQFLQLKHGCKLSMQSLKAVFVSNVSYFKEYKLLYGLTGTLGSQGERHMLEEVHQVDFVTIPPSKSKQFEEYDPIICLGHKKWLENICSEVAKIINVENRSVLIICDTINDVKCVEKSLEVKFKEQIHTYERDFEEFDIVKGTEKLQPKQIIIATNLAGRGTDIRITDGLKEAGGLHVILTYLPENVRIEEQAFGRAARSGDRGSGGMIVMVTGRKQYRKSKIIDLKKKRDKNELYRISEVKSYYEKTIRTEERCFEKFRKVYEKHRLALDRADVPKEVKTILLESCLDQWAFWLDEHSSLMEEFIHECDEKRTPAVLKTFLKKMERFCVGDGAELNCRYWKEWVEGNPMRMVKLAKYLAENHIGKSFLEKMKIMGKNVLNTITSKFEGLKTIQFAHLKAMDLFVEVINAEPHFCEAAYYYRAYTIMKLAELKQSESEKNAQYKRDLRQATQLFENHYAKTVQEASIVEKFKNVRISYEDYKQQKDTIAGMYQVFIKSIEDILGHTVSPDAFVSEHVKADEGERIFEYLLDEKIVSKPIVRNEISDKQLQVIHQHYNVSIKDLEKFFTSKAAEEIDEEWFMTQCKSAFKFPSREQFWEILVKEKVLTDVQDLVKIDFTKLEAVDPSLKDAISEMVESKTLTTLSIEVNEELILLYHEWLALEQQNVDVPTSDNCNNVAIFEKDKFIEKIGEKKYEILAKMSIVTNNQKTKVNKSLLSSCVLTTYASISVEDIVTKSNIELSEAELIMKELVKQGVLEQSGQSYVLKGGLYNTEQITIPSYPCYQAKVRTLLKHCLAYSLELNHLREQLDDESSTGENAIRINLPCHVYLTFFQELLKQNIIQPCKVTEKHFDKETAKVCTKNLTKDDWSVFFIERLLISKQDADELVRSLLKGNRIHKRSLSAKIKENISIISQVNFGNVYLADYYDVNEKNDSNSKLSFTPKTSGFACYDIGKTVEINLQHQLKMSDTQNNIESTLKQLKSSLIGLDVPAIYLRSIREVNKEQGVSFGSMEEEYSFSLNGLERLIQLEEKKWSLKLRIVIVAAIAEAQIIAGSILGIWSLGAMTSVASALINEGVNDLMYACNAFKTGRFSWMEYGKEKAKSTITTGIMTGVAAWWSRGAKQSKIMHKIYSTENGWNKAINMTVKRIIMKNGQALAQGLVVSTVDKVVDDYLQTKIDSIAKDILSAITKLVDDHKVNETLEKMYYQLGEQRTRQLVQEFYSTFGTNSWDGVKSIAMEMTYSLSQSFVNALQKTNSKRIIMKILSQVSTAWVWGKRVAQLSKMCYAVSQFFNTIDKQMCEKLNTLEQKLDEKECPAEVSQKKKESFEAFKSEFINQWKKLLREHVGKLISANIIEPLFNQAFNRVKQLIKRIPRNSREMLLKRKMKRLKKAHDELQKEKRKEMEGKYHENLQKIMCKTKSPSLFADIIEEGIPMDFTCVEACAPLIRAFLKAQGINTGALVITVRAAGGVNQSFCSGSADDIEKIKQINLKLDGNHFEFSKNQQNSDGNNCLHSALCDAIPSLKEMNADDFRKKIAETIRKDPGVQHHIRQGWHRYPIKHLDCIGGKEATKRDDEENEELDEHEEMDNDCNPTRIRQTSYITLKKIKGEKKKKRKGKKIRRHF